MSDVLLPSNSTAQERAMEASIAQRLRVLPVRVREVWNPETCPADVLPWLAWAFSVDEWSPLWSEQQKRQTIKNSIVIHRYKGTIGAVREAVAALGVDSAVQEWFNQIPEANPYTFRLYLKADQVGVPQDFFDTLLGVVLRTKNLRSHLDTIQLEVRTQAGPKAAACVSIGNEITITGFQGRPMVVNENAIAF